MIRCNQLNRIFLFMIFNLNGNPYGELRKFRTCLFPNKIGSRLGLSIVLVVVLSAMLTTHQYNVWGQSGDSDKKSKHGQSLEKSQSGDSDKKSKHAQSLDKLQSGDSVKKSKDGQSLDKLQSGDSVKKSKDAQSLDKTKSNGKNNCDEICQAFEEESQEESEDDCMGWCKFCRTSPDPELIPECRKWVG